MLRCFINFMLDSVKFRRDTLYERTFVQKPGGRLMTHRPPATPEDTRTSILDAAYLLFIHQGYHATSMRQIAAHAGIALGGIYNHFNAKEDIFREILLMRHPYREIISAVPALNENHLEARVHSIAHIMVDTLQQHPDLLNLMLIEIVEFNGSHMPELFREILPAIVPIFQDIFQDDPRLRSIPVPILIRVFIGMFFSYHMTAKFLAPVAPSAFIDNAIDYFIDIYLKGIIRCDNPLEHSTSDKPKDA
jgi:AcrR family transcriptional regulator